MRNVVPCPCCKGRQVFIGQDGQQLVCYFCAGNGHVMIEEDPRFDLHHQWDTQRHESAFSEITIRTIRCRFCCIDQTSSNLQEICPTLLQMMEGIRDR